MMKLIEEQKVEDFAAGHQKISMDIAGGGFVSEDIKFDVGKAKQEAIDFQKRQ